jgi:hypothetical protein
MFSLSRSFSCLFLRTKRIFASHANSAVATENAADELSAMMYFGSSDLGHRYGVLKISLLALAFEFIRKRSGLEEERRLTR